MGTVSVTVAFARPATSVADARDSARTFLERLVRPIAAEAADSVILFVSEVVTNVLRHSWWAHDEQGPRHVLRSPADGAAASAAAAPVGRFGSAGEVAG
ncbi:hypothetical protein ACIQM3_07645 [Streptomyces sp. NPDC091271]|uniref:hypothetical protein n=1 Tax=Streptomyces sp. NPDC091271 TaxID=3365980 RepID=UPI00382D1A9D